jgi:hypothetical protein
VKITGADHTNWLIEAGTGLYETGIVRSNKPRSYLPAIILAITEES